jgi:hypothetical protein
VRYTTPCALLLPDKSSAVFSFQQPEKNVLRLTAHEETDRKMRREGAKEKLEEIKKEGSGVGVL